MMVSLQEYFDAKPTGVEVEAAVEVETAVPQEQEDNGLSQQVPTPEANAESYSLRCSSHLTKKWKQSYIPSYKGTKYDLALTQVTKLLQGAKNATSLAQMSIKLMSKKVYCKADIMVGAIMAQRPPSRNGEKMPNLPSPRR